MNILLALAAGISLGANDAGMHLSYPQFNELFPSSVILDEPQHGNDDDLQSTIYLPFREHVYSASFDSSFNDFTFGYSFGIGKFGNLMSGELLNITMIEAAVLSEHARLIIEYSASTSNFGGDFIEGLFATRNKLGFSAEFPAADFTPGFYASMRTKHLPFFGENDFDARLGVGMRYGFLDYFSVSAFYEHEWISGSWYGSKVQNSSIDRGGVGFSLAY